MATKPFTHTVTGKVTRVIRHGHTINGNPIMSIVIDRTDGGSTEWGDTWRISNDAGLVYAIENAEYRDRPHVFDVTAAGRISGYTMTVPEYLAKTDGKDATARAIHNGVN